MNAKNSDWQFHVEARGSGEIEISVYDFIGGSLFADGVTAKDVLATLSRNPSAKTIRLRINSVGGILDDAKAMVNLLNARRKDGATVEAHIDGLAASSAAYLTVAADKVLMPENAFLMIHETRGGARGNAAQMANMADLLRRSNDQMASAFAAASARRGKGKTSEDFLASFAEGDRYLDAEEAIEWGLADEKVEAIDVAASLADVSELSDAPPAIMSAPYAARARVGDTVNVVTKQPHPAPQGPTASTDPGDAEHPQEDSMNLAELKEKHPGVYAAAVAEGKAQGIEEGATNERKRVNAHLKMGVSHNAMDTAVTAIANGSTLSDEEVLAEYYSKRAKGEATADRQEDSDKAIVAIEGAAPAPEPTEDFGDKVVAARKAMKGGF